jgi:hypothetical protein
MHFVKQGDVEPVSEDEANMLVDAARITEANGNVHKIKGPAAREHGNGPWAFNPLRN